MTRRCSMIASFGMLTVFVTGHGSRALDALPAAQVTEDTRTVTTTNRFSMTFDGRGRVESMSVEGKPVPIAADRREQSGWTVTDVQAGRSVNVRNWTSSSKGDSLEQEADVSELGVRLRVEYVVEDDYLRMVGTVFDETGKERALDLTFALPVDAAGWLWETDITDRVPIPDTTSTVSVYKQSLSAGLGPANSTRLTGELAAFPFVAISSIEEQLGLTLAVPADVPMVFDGGYDKGLLQLTVKVGTSPYYKTPNETRFEMMAFSHGPRWGFRDVLRRYYEFFPQYFTNRVPRHGLSTTYVSEDPYPEDIAFHLIDEPASQARTVDEYTNLGNVPFAREHKILSFPYTIWGQRQVFLETQTLIEDPDEAWKAMKAWEPDVPMYYATTLPALNYKTPPEHKEIIEASVVHGPNRKPVFVPRVYWHKNALTFPTNPDPDLFADRDVMTVGKFHFKYYRHLLEHIPDLAGIFHDSQYGWGLYFNFRREHFKYADRALSYHPTSKEVCLYNQFSLNESLEALREAFPDKLVFANGLRPNFVYNVFPSDIVAVELLDVSKLHDPHQASWYRTAAGPKPVIAWSYRDWDQPDKIDEFWQRSLLYGYALSARGILARPVDFDLGQERIGPELENAARRKYVPALRAISSAGWHPVTHAWIEGRTTLQVERFGPDGDGKVYFTVFNPEEREVSVDLTIQADALELKQLSKAVSLVPDHSTFPVSTAKDGRATVQVSVRSKKTQVLMLQ
ncbi:MAG: hypothetical protein GEU99_10115 [Luteitalea sp.]|nr:hypothetical protein [Luteitalea sp.]